MDVKKAVERSEKLEEIKNILDNGGYFCSAFITLNKGEEIEKWNLGFYSEEQDEITAVKVTQDGASIEVTDEPLRDTTHRMETDKINTGAEEALDTAKEELENEYSDDYKRILLSLKKKDGQQEWNAVFIQADGRLVSVEVDTQSGEVLHSEQSSLIDTGKSVGG